MIDDPLGPLDPDFAVSFKRDDRRPPCQLYVVSPLDVSGGFSDRLARSSEKRSADRAARQSTPRDDLPRRWRAAYSSPL